MQPQRRSYSKSFKAQVIQACAQPDSSIASIALSHSLNANLVHKWIRVLYRCWQTRTPYDETTYLNALRKRGSPLLKNLDLG